jgi:hypothetical protein
LAQPLGAGALAMIMSHMWNRSGTSCRAKTAILNCLPWQKLQRFYARSGNVPSLPWFQSLKSRASDCSLKSEVGMQTLEVLMIEDNSVDRFWLEYVLKSLRPDCSFSSVPDGETAVDFLLKRGTHVEAPTPDLIFLDLHLPKLNGIEVLRQVPNAHKLPL